MPERVMDTSALVRPLPASGEPRALPFSVPTFVLVYAASFVAAGSVLSAGQTLGTDLEALAVVLAAALAALTGSLAARNGFGSAFRASLLAAVLAALCVAVAYRSFRNAGFDPLSAPFWPALAAAVSLPIARTRGLGTSVLQRTDPLAAVTIFGILLSAALCEYPWWWQRSVSYLGYGPNLHRWVFDATVLACSALCFMRASEVGRLLSALEPMGLIDSTRRRVTSGIYLVAAVSLLFVAIFPYGNGRSSLWAWVHNIGAWIAFGVFLVAMVAAPRLTPFLREDLRRESVALCGVVMGLFALYWPGRYLSLALFEVLSLILILMWLARWTRSLAAVARSYQPEHGEATP